MVLGSGPPTYTTPEGECQQQLDGVLPEAVATTQNGAEHRPLAVRPPHPPGPRPPTLHGHVVHRQLQALATPHHPHRVPLVVVELVSRKQGLGAFTCGTKGGVSLASVPAHTHSPGAASPPQACAHKFKHSLRHIPGCATHHAHRYTRSREQSSYTPRHTRHCHSVQHPRGHSKRIDVARACGAVPWALHRHSRPTTNMLLPVP